MIRFGLQISDFAYPATPPEHLFERVAGIAQTAEQSGFDSVFLMDHFFQIPELGSPEDPMLECYTTLSALAARTQRVGLGILVTGVTHRNPALLAKMVTTIDVISGGRAILGIGAAWHQQEHHDLGFDFPGSRERLDRLEEALQICRAMFTEDSPSFHGHYYRIESARNLPRPLRPGGVPILVGGGGERRTLRLVARYADACNFFGDLGTVRSKLAVLDRHCEQVGRDPAEITRTRLGSLIIAPTQMQAERKVDRIARAWPWGQDAFRAAAVAGDAEAVAEQARAYLDAGLDGLIFNIPDTHDLELVALAGEALRRAEIR